MEFVEKILDLARWAPSGDNTQPWRFERVDHLRFVVHGFDTRDHVVYDVGGIPSHMAHGALLENIGIAATAHGMRAAIRRRPDTPDTHLLFDVALVADPSVTPHALIPAITERVTQRRAMRTTPLAREQKAEIEAAVGPGYQVLWIEGAADRWRMARLLFRNARLRLTMPEAYPVHRDIIEWNARFSEDRIPDQALGANPFTLRMMRSALESWERVEFLNRWLAGTLAPRLELDLIPGWFCAAHFLIAGERPWGGIDAAVAGGGAMQRAWLTAAKLGLCVQPEMTSLIFATYVRENRRFTVVDRVWSGARQLAGELAEFLGGDRLTRSVFMGRIGSGPAPRARSTRLPLGKLWFQAGSGAERPAGAAR